MLLNMQKREKQDLLFIRSDADTDFFLKGHDPDTGFSRVGAGPATSTFKSVVGDRSSFSSVYPASSLFV